MKQESSELVLVLRPFTSGLAFALFESALSPIDWGIREITGGKWNARCASIAREFIDRFKPEILVLPAEAAPPRGQSGRAARLLKLLANHAADQSVEVRCHSREEIRAAFRSTGATTRYEIAQTIALQIPAFAHRLPPPRRNWNDEPRRLYLFDAAALAMTYYASPPEQP